MFLSSLSSSSNFNNSKLYFSKYEFNRILACYSSGISKGYWKDYSMDFKKNEAIFSIYRNTNTNPIFLLIKFKILKKNRYFYKLNENNKICNLAKNFDDLIITFNRKNLKIIK